MAQEKARRLLVSRKIRKVKRERPGLTNRQAAGRAHGILRSKGRIR